MALSRSGRARVILPRSKKTREYFCFQVRPDCERRLRRTGKSESSGRGHIRPAGLPAVRPADQRPEGLALSPPVLGGLGHHLHRLLELVPVPAAEMFALFEN